MNSLRPITFFTSIMLLQSCALMISKKHQEVTFHSNENHVKVYDNLTFVGYTNETINLPRTSLDHLYTFKKEGCETKQIVLPLETNNWIWIDLPGVVLLNLPYLIDYGHDVHIKTTTENVPVHISCDSLDAK